MCRVFAILIFTFGLAPAVFPENPTPSTPALEETFPTPLPLYRNSGSGIVQVLQDRVEQDPLNLIATVIFLAAIVHTFFTARIRHWAHKVEEQHLQKLKTKLQPLGKESEILHAVSFSGQILHFFAETEAVFGIWAVALAFAIVLTKGIPTAINYLGKHVNYTEALFVVVVMAIVSTRPILQLAERFLRALSRLGGGSPAMWWLAILIVAPIFGSFITEPAAMTISALLLGKEFYALKPGRNLKYATLGLLFVNVSVGGTLSHFAAPSVLMVAEPWGWDTAFMFEHFGWKAVAGITASTLLYYFVFRRDLKGLKADLVDHEPSTGLVPAWVVVVHLGFLAYTVSIANYPALFIGGFLFFLAFIQATTLYQNGIDLRNPIFVGFFLAGLVVHGGLQGWWLQPLLGRLKEVPLFFGAMGLTAFNDNAAITYLATLVPNLSEELKYAVVAGAVTGGGLTVIANAPNPAGQLILGRFFPKGISPLGLFLGAAVPTVLIALIFMLT